ncbi:MAG: DUF4215 domain-containing protein [Bradymonadia bacterium]
MASRFTSDRLNVLAPFRGLSHSHLFALVVAVTLTACEPTTGDTNRSAGTADVGYESDVATGMLDASATDAAFDDDSLLERVDMNTVDAAEVRDVDRPSRDADVLLDGARDATAPPNSDAEPADVAPIDAESLDLSPPPGPAETCGDGRVSADEVCDDGNLQNGDGCDSLCTLERQMIRRGRTELTLAIPPGHSETLDFRTVGLSTFEYRLADAPCDVFQDIVVSLVSANDGRILRVWNAADLNNDCGWHGVQVGGGRFELRIESNDAANARQIALDLRIYQEVTDAGFYFARTDRDGNARFELDVPERQRWGFTTLGIDDECDIDTWIDIYAMDDAGERLLDFDNDGGQGTCSRLVMGFEAGRYALVVRERFNRPLDLFRVEAQTVGACGDGRIDLDETCDDGDRNGVGTCSEQCEPQSVCGNRAIEVGETCDDGNQLDGDGCSAACQQELVCGNGRVDEDEDCDDGNPNHGDGCDFFCTFEEIEFTRGRHVARGHFGRRLDDRYLFVADGPGRLVAETYVPVDDNWRCRPSANTLLSLYEVAADGSRVLVAQNDDDPINAPCSILDVELGVGAHLLKVSGADGDAAINDYWLAFRFSREVTGQRVIEGGFEETGADLYEFELFADRTVELFVAAGDEPCQMDTRLGIYRRGTELPMPVQPLGVADCNGVRAGLPAGRYDLVIDRAGGGALPSYSVDVDWDVR